MTPAVFVRSVKLRHTPPISDRKRVPAVYETIDMAGIGEKPTIRSGP